MSTASKEACPLTDISITVPSKLAFGRTWGRWTIRHCLEKLKTKYGKRKSATYYSLEFDGYASERSLADASWLNRIEAADIWATMLMQSRYRERDVDQVMRKVNPINSALSKVPIDLSLEQALDPQDWKKIEKLLISFMAPGVGLAKTTKVLSMKRPRLIPMLDSFVMGFLFKDGETLGTDSPVGTGVVAIKQLRELLCIPGNWTVVNWLADQINEWLASRISHRPPPKLTPLRVLESLIWFDGDGYKLFKWKLVGNDVRRR